MFNHDDDLSGGCFLMIILFLIVSGMILFISNIFKNISGFFRISFLIVFIILVLIAFFANLHMELTHNIRILTFIELIGDMFFWIPTIFCIVLEFSEFQSKEGTWNNLIYSIEYFGNLIVIFTIVGLVTFTINTLKNTLLNSKNVFLEFCSTFITYATSLFWIYLIIKLMKHSYNHEILKTMQNQPSYVIDIIKFCIELKIK